VTDDRRHLAAKVQTLKFQAYSLTVDPKKEIIKNAVIVGITLYDRSVIIYAY